MRAKKVDEIIEETQEASIEINVTTKEQVKENGWRGAVGTQGRKKVKDSEKKRHKLGGYFSDDDKKKLEQAMLLEGIDVNKKTGFAELIRKCVTRDLYRQGIFLDN